MIKEYLNVKSIENNSKVNCLKIETDYNLGGINYFTSGMEKRGYYLSIYPIEHTNDGYERYTAFSGIKQLIKEVGRRSAKAEKEVDKLAENYKQNLIDYVCQQNGLEIIK